MSDFILEAVKCKNCGSGLAVEVNDNIVYCTSCGSGFEEIDGEMKNIDIDFASAAIRSEGELIYKPFWLLHTSITVHERKATGNFIKNLFGGSNDFTNGRDDAKKLAEFILISLEAEKSDVITSFNYEMKVNSYSILGIPFYDLKNGRYKDAILGIEF